jgi:hypothetical protein
MNMVQVFPYIQYVAQRQTIAQSVICSRLHSSGASLPLRSQQLLRYLSKMLVATRSLAIAQMRVILCSMDVQSCQETISVGRS